MFVSRSPQVNKKYGKDYLSEPRSYTFMSPEDASSGRQSVWTEVEITGLCRNLSPVLFQFEHLTSLYLNDNQLTFLPPEICQLKRLVHLNASSNRLRSIPPEIGRMTALRELLLNNNQLRGLPFELGQLFLLQKLALSGNPLPAEIMGILSEPNGNQKLLGYLLDRLPYNQLQPLPRQWVQLSTPNDSHPVGLFTVMCYNVLCDKYATRAQYGYCPSWALNWDYRKKGILEEIRRGGADILALQEIETEQYNTFFLPELKELGYDSVFSPRSRARTMHESERKHVDGCAIFFRRTKFSLVHEHLIEFNQMAMSSAEGSHEMLNRVMTKDNIGFAALLEAKDAFWVHGLPPEGSHRQQQLLVTTCHIHWDPAFCDVKLVQSIMLMHELKNIVNEAQLTLRPGASGSNDCNGIPLVLCGDFNSLPDSGVVQYLSTGRMEANHREFIDIGYNDCLQKMSTSDGKDSYTHNFRLQQAYTADTLKCTNFTHDFKGIIDYVFFSRDWIRTLGVLAMTETSWFDQHHIVGCPHPSVPSDHLPLLVELELDPLSSPFTSSSSSSSSSRNLYQHPNHR